MSGGRSVVLGALILGLTACGAAGVLASPPLEATTQADAGAQANAPLKLIHRTELPEYKGDFDEFAVDITGHRLFLAGEEGGTLEVFDLNSGARLKTMTGFEEPHSIHFMPKTNRLIVTDAGDSMTKVVDGATYKIIGAIKLVPGADIMQYDPSTGHVWIDSGGKNAKQPLKQITVSEVDPATGDMVGQPLQFDTDYTKMLAFEQKGDRAFINVGGRSEVVKFNKRTHQVLATWPVTDGQMNGPMAFDEENHRLFIITRKPFQLVVMDSDTGASIAHFKAPERANGLIFDKANRRLYLTGDNEVAIFDQKSADRYVQLTSVPSVHGAKTGILVPELHRLYVAVSPGEATGGAVLTYDVAPQ